MLRFITVALILFALPSCIGKRPFKQIQLCLHDQASSQLFMQMMKEMSVAHGMKFTDRSTETNREMTTLKVKPNYEVMNISAIRHDGVGWGAGNTGLSEFEVSIGFGQGSNTIAAHEFANAVIEALEKEWYVYQVPQDRGAFPRCAAEKPNNSFKPSPLRGLVQVL
ncbi:MAG: hypothetical protein EOP50_00835 [Sphingobacteriales bacterium]|nr:MAG: hypothetical protein EOP50_00835 [Sphingobacteriales bacterium]